MMQTMKFLGTFAGTKKTTNKPFYLAYMYGEDKGTLGFRAYSFFVEEDLYHKLKSIQPLKDIKADVRLINSSNVLIDVEA